MTPEKPSRKRWRRFAGLDARPDLLVGGGTLQMIHTLPKEVGMWLVSNVPQDGTINELIAAIITDAYNDEKGA